MRELILNTGNGSSIEFEGGPGGETCCIDLLSKRGEGAYDYIDKDQSILVIEYLKEFFKLEMSGELELTAEAVNAVQSLMHDFRYNYEGPMNSDSIEEWVDKWIENKTGKDVTRLTV